MNKDAQAMLGILIGLGGGNSQEWADTVEKAGQSELVHADKLPAEMGYEETTGMYEQLGIVFGKLCDGIFLEAALPEGWRKKPTPHYMWSKVLDATGRERISIFYKPEFYDRSAHMSLERRYNRRSEYDDPSGRGQPEKVRVVITDGGTVIHTIGESTRTEYKFIDALHRQADAYLNEHFPDWCNPLAYWD